MPASRSPRKGRRRPNPPPTDVRELTSFVGRTADVENVIGMLRRDVPLVTVVGPPGIGKTRLALRVRREASSRHRSPGTSRRALSTGWFCDLRSAQTESDLHVAMNHALEIGVSRRGATGDERQRIGELLALRGPCLIVLDNFESLVEVAAEAVSTWMRTAPEARFLITSRKGLRLCGEHLIELAPLGLPTANDDWGAPAMRLFEDRTRAIVPSFDRAAAQASGAAELVRALQGLPLAIELAAGHMNRTSPRELTATIRSDGFRLRALDRDRDPRHATLHAAIASSWQFLKPWEQTALRQLMVFRGGFGLDAAESVLDLSAHADAPPVADIVASLREASLLRDADERPPDGSVRWDVYEAIRQDVSDRSDGRCNIRATSERHATYFVELGTRLANDLPTRDGLGAKAHLLLELDNFRAAFAWLIDEKPRRPKRIAQMALVLYAAWRNWIPSLAVEALTEALERPNATPPLSETTVLRLLIARAECRRASGDYERAGGDLVKGRELALEDAHLTAELDLETAKLHLFRGEIRPAQKWALRALEAASCTDDSQLKGRAHALIAWVTTGELYDPSGFEHDEKAAQLLKQCGDLREEAIARTLWAAHRLYLGRGDSTQELEDPLRVARQFGDRQLESWVLQATGMGHQEAGNIGQAITFFRSAAEVSKKHALSYARGCATLWLATALEEVGDDVEADRAFNRAARVFAQTGNRRDAAWCGVLRSGLLAKLGDGPQARKLLAQGKKAARELRDTPCLSLLALQRARIDALSGKHLPRRSPPTGFQRGTAARFVLRMHNREAQGRAKTVRRLRVRDDGSAFHWGGESSVELPRGPAIRRVLRTLCEHRLKQPGQTLGCENLVRLGWPGERVSPAAGAMRVRNAIARLRRLGLEGVLLTAKTGWLLDPKVQVELESRDSRSIHEPFSAPSAM